MNKNLLAMSIVAATLAVVPLLASAQTITASGSASGSVVATPIMWGPGPSCPHFLRSLSFGASGDDVTTLQTFLAARGYFKVSPTGYFGPLTRTAVARWQEDDNVIAQGNTGSGFFGPLSRAFFIRSCGTTTPATTTFSANPQSGPAPLVVQFTSSAPQGSSVGSAVTFGDGSSGMLAFAPTCANCNAIATVSHTYSTSGTYIASLTSGNCACPMGGTCNCPMIQILATTTVAVGPAGSTTSTSTIQRVNAPGTVTLSSGGIAEVRNKSYYFTLENLTYSSSATIQLTPVGCWNSFPSDTPPQIRCMIAVVLTPPQMLSVGQNYQSGNFNLTLTAINNGQATFSIN